MQIANNRIAGRSAKTSSMRFYGCLKVRSAIVADSAIGWAATCGASNVSSRARPRVVLYHQTRLPGKPYAKYVISWQSVRQLHNRVVTGTVLICIRRANTGLVPAASRINHRARQQFFQPGRIGCVNLRHKAAFVGKPHVFLILDL